MIAQRDALCRAEGEKAVFRTTSPTASPCAPAAGGEGKTFCYDEHLLGVRLCAQEGNFLPK
jgi:hypothetical protein